MSERIYWMGWNVPTNQDDSDWAANWPDKMRGWWTGEGEGYQTYVGLVRAPNEELAWSLILSCYGSSANLISKRDICKDVTDKWCSETEFSDRFPGAAETFQKLRSM